MRYARALGWAAFSAGPVLLTALALIASRPNAPESLITSAAIAGWVAGTLAFGASLLHQHGRRGMAKIGGAIAALVVIASCAFLAWSATTLERSAIDARPRSASTD